MYREIIQYKFGYVKINSYLYTLMRKAMMNISPKGQQMLLKSISVSMRIINEYGVDRDELSVRINQLMDQILHKEGGDDAYDKLDMALDSLVDEYKSIQLK